MEQCLICGREHPSQSQRCPAPDAPERFARVYRRLHNEGRNHRLQTALFKYLVLFGIPTADVLTP